MSTEPALVVERHASGVIELRLNRPERRNAVTTEMARLLRDELIAIGDDRSLKVVVLTGTGTTFCAGADLAEFAGDTPADPGDTMARLRLVIGAVHGLLTAEPVTIAAVEGAAIGAGWGFALACDTCWADDTAKFALPEVAKGFRVPRVIATRLAQVVGPVRAAELVLSGRLIETDEAFTLGAVARRVTPPGSTRESALEFATQLATHPRSVLRGAVDAFRTLAVPGASPEIDYQWPGR